MEVIRIGIVGYGNLARGLEKAIEQSPDMKLEAVFTRRNPESVSVKTPGVKVLNISEAMNYIDKIDVMVLCGGSAKDLPEQGPMFAGKFNTVDSFDTHAKIPEYFAAVDKAAAAGGKVSIISVGWDPGLFSINRLMAEAILPEGKGYTFWGRGVSQGHSDAIRRVPGVKAGIQYTIPIEEAMNKARSGDQPDLSTREKHLRECYVVAEEGADRKAIEYAIKSMPNYFADYDTTVTFITEEELIEKHSEMPHGGFVIHSGRTGSGVSHVIEYSLKLGSNPEFTSSVLASYARAAYRMYKEGQNGAKSVFDIPPAYLSSKSNTELLKEYL